MSDQALTESTPAIKPEAPVRYATFTRRFRAFVIDTACLWGVVLALFFIGDAMSDVPGVTLLTWLLMLAVILLYDPVLVSRRGATVGHAGAQLRVIDARTGQWPTFARSFARNVVKIVLGVPSFFTMELSRRHQAVHDMLTQTTVQVAESAELVEFRIERVNEPDVLLPSRLRRLTVIALYLVAVLVVCDESISLVDMIACIRPRGCSAGALVLVQAIGLGWLALSAVAIVAGWRGRLLGARRIARVGSGAAVV